MPSHASLQSVFSDRQYMLSQDFELFYYADTNLTHVDLHTHDYYEFYFFVQGDVHQRIGSADYTLHPGDLVVVPPGTPHQTKILSHLPYRRFVFWVSEAYLRAMKELSPSYAYLSEHVASSQEYVFPLDIITFNTFQSRLFMILGEISSSRFGKDSLLTVHVHELMLLMNRTVYEMKNPVTMHTDREVYLSLISYIEENIEGDLTLDALSSQLFMNKYYLAHLFKNQTGISVHQYIIKKRLQRCMEIIGGGSGISEACRLCGFRDYSSFYRAFKKEYGISPKAYLKK